MIDGKHTFTRETFICPVEIQDGELVFNPGYGYMTPVVSRHEMGRMPKKKDHGEHFDFNGDSLPIGWYYNRIPHEKDYTVADGTLLLKLRPETIDSLVCPAMLMRKPTSHKYSATTKLTFTSKKKNEQAGMVLHRNNGAYVALLKGSDCLELIIKDKGEKRLLERIPYTDKNVVIRLSCNDLTGVFSYGPSPDQLTTTAPFSLLPLTEDNRQNRFNGLGIGLYASSNGKKSKAQAAFDYYDYKDFPETELPEGFTITAQEMQHIYDEVKNAI